MNSFYAVNEWLMRSVFKLANWDKKIKKEKFNSDLLPFFVALLLLLELRLIQLIDKRWKFEINL